VGARRSGDRVGCDSTDLRHASQDKLFEVVVDPSDAVGDGDMAPQCSDRRAVFGAHRGVQMPTQAYKESDDDPGYDSINAVAID
jgi:hypothetical protein